MSEVTVLWAILSLGWCVKSATERDTVRFLVSMEVAGLGRICLPLTGCSGSLWTRLIDLRAWTNKALGLLFTILLFTSDKT